MIVLGQLMGAAAGVLIYLLATGELHDWPAPYFAGMLAITALDLILEDVLQKHRKEQAKERR